METRLKIAVAVFAAIASLAVLGFLRLRPWFAPPPAPAEEIDANWFLVTSMAEPDPSCSGDLESWREVHAALDSLSADTLDLIQERYEEALPLPLAAFPPDAIEALEAGQRWTAAAGGYLPTIGDPLDVHRLGQLIAIAETPSRDLDALGERLAARAMRCGSLVDFAVGVSIAEGVLARPSVRPPETFDLGPDGLVAVMAREAVGTVALLDQMAPGSPGLAMLDEKTPPLVSIGLERERRMMRWYWGARIAHSAGTSAVAETVERLRFEPDLEGIRSPVLEIVAIAPSGVFDDYLAMLDELEALRSGQ